MKDVDDVIATYRPNPRRVAPAIWEQCRETAQLAVRLGGADTTCGAQEDFRALSGILEFGTLYGHGTNLRVLLAPDFIEYFYEAYLLKQKVRQKKLIAATADTYRSRLRRLGRKLNPTAWPPPPRTGHRKTLLSPFYGWQVRLMLQQALLQKTPQLCDAMSVVICLSCGAGLTAGEIMHCHDDDLHWDKAGRLLVHVGGDGKATTPVTPRTVPVLNALGMADRLVAIAGRVDASGLLIGQWGTGRHDPFGKIVDRFQIPAGVPRPQTRRVRNAGLLCLLSMKCLHVCDIMRMAGLVSTTSIEDLIQLILPDEGADALASQAGGWLEE